MNKIIEKVLVIIAGVWVLLLLTLALFSATGCKTLIPITNKQGYWTEKIGESSIKVYGEAKYYSAKDSTYIMSTEDCWNIKVKNSQITWVK